MNWFMNMANCNLNAEDSDMCEIIIEFKDVNKSQEELIKKYGTIKHYFPMINSYVVELSKKYIAELENLENVASVFESTYVAAQMNCSRRAVRADSAHANGYNGKSITIAFLDTGIAPISDFTSPKNRIVAFKDFVNAIDSPYDDNGHGTHAAYLNS